MINTPFYVPIEIKIKQKENDPEEKSKRQNIFFNGNSSQPIYSNNDNCQHFFNCQNPNLLSQIPKTTQADNFYSDSSTKDDILFSGCFGSKLDETNSMNNYKVQPFDDQSRNSVYSLGLTKENVDDNPKLHHSNSQKSFFDLMKNINFQSFNLSSSAFISKPKKKILTTEELLLDRIKKEREAVSALKQKTVTLYEKSKNLAPRPLIQPHLTSLQPFSTTESSSMLKRKRITNPDEVCIRGKENNIKKIIRNEKLKVNDKENDCEIMDLTNRIESVSLTKQKNRESLKCNSNLKQNLASANISQGKSLTFKAMINNAKSENMKVLQEVKQMTKKQIVPDKKYYYKGKHVLG